MRALCVVHANCQGDVLQGLLEESPAFVKRFVIQKYTNYTREPIPGEVLDKCGLFLYQALGEEWGEFSSKALLARLPSSCQSIRIPNLFFKGYWPFWTSEIKAIDFADTLLEKLFSLKLPPKDILSIYLNGNHPDFYAVPKIARSSLQIEREKDAESLLPCASIIEQFWRDEMLFYTVNHPAKRLMIHVAQSLLSLLGLPPFSEDFCRNYIHPDANFCLPIHPVVGKMLHLRFTGPHVRYTLYNQNLTHTDFVLAYLACRMLNTRNIAAFFHNREGSSSL